MGTDSSPPRPSGAQRATDAAHARDAGLRLTRRAQGWITAAAVGMASALAALTAHAYHARAAASTVTTAPAARPPVDDGQGDSGATTPAPSVQPPAAAPVPAPATNVAPVVSGGS
jgi:hypothetical protein